MTTTNTDFNTTAAANTAPSDFRQAFVRFAIEHGVLRFGQFTTKAGRQSPYFFNAGTFNDGATLIALSDFYAQAVLENGICFDMLFGPAYKGIVLASALAMALAKAGHNTAYAYNRKEAKDHGEGGTLVGAPVRGKVLIVDDVISAGTSVRESVQLIRQAGAEPVGVVIALDRQERGQGALSASAEVRAQFGLPVIAVATLDDLVRHVRNNSAHNAALQPTLEAIERYRQQYGYRED